jgi:hypothetical protein
MKRLFSILPLIVTAIASFLSASSFFAQAQVPAGPNRPAQVPEGYVITPSGYFHPSCVLQIAEGETLMARGRVLQHADGSLANVPACTYPHYTARGEIVAAGVGSVEPPSISHSWIEDANITTGTSYGELTATWTVPVGPTTNDGQTVYFFPGLEDVNDVVSIIQPVLGWYGGQWTIASWNCCPSGITVESSPVSVNAGDTILGTIKNTCSPGTESCSTWNITTDDETTGKSTTLGNTPSEGQTFNWAFAGALEVYDVVQCPDYPPNNSLIFSDVALYDDNFDLISNPGWSIANYTSGLTPQCNYGGQTAAAQVTLDYGTATASASPTSLTLYAPVGCTGKQGLTTLTNNGPSGLAIYEVEISGSFSRYGNGGDCSTTKALAPGGSCDVTVVYDGIVGGAKGGIYIYDSASNSPQVVALTGKDLGTCTR